MGHFLIQEAFAGTIRLYPFSVDDKLGDGAFAGALNYFFGGSGRSFDIDFLESDPVLLQKSFRFAAVGAPKAGIDSYFHRDI